MRKPSISRLETAFNRWRATKSSRFDPVPESLLTRARQAADVFGVEPVIQVTGLSAKHFSKTPSPKIPKKKSMPAKPKITAVSVGMPAHVSKSNLFCEMEIPGGVKLRFYGDPQASAEIISALLRGRFAV